MNEPTNVSYDTVDDAITNLEQMAQAGCDCELHVEFDNSRQSCEVHK